MPEYTYKCDTCSVHTSLVCSIGEYDKKSKKVTCHECGSKDVYRDFDVDHVDIGVVAGLSDATNMTIGEYAEKQSARLGKQTCENMMADFKTKQEGGMQELPVGMKRMEKSEPVKWTKDSKPTKKKRAVKKRKK